MVNLAPLAKPVAITPGDHVLKQQVTFCIKEKFLSFHGDDFNIVNAATGAPEFKVRGPPITFHDRKTVCSADGKEKLYVIRYYHDGTHQFVAERLDIIDPNVMFTDPHLPVFDLCDVKDAADGTTMVAQLYVPHADTQKATRGPRYALKGPFDNEAGAPIVDMDSGETVALIHRECDIGFSGVLLSQVPESYFVTIAPGADAAVMAGIAVCFDELHNLHRHSHAPSAANSRPASTRPSTSTDARPSTSTQGPAAAQGDPAAALSAATASAPLSTSVTASAM